MLAETIAAGARAQENLKLGALAPYLTTAMLSDITREMGLTCTLPRGICGDKRIFGRAKTLQLDHTRIGESWKGIYEALDSYQFVRPGDVIMVANPVQNRAYFGSLNAQLAMRAGAVGAVVDGVTRDFADVQRLNFPVFARGHYCLDIKYEGTLRSMNAPISIEGVTVENGDYVFGDNDGVVAVPFKKWPEVRELALVSIEKEWNVGMAVALGVEARQIVSKLGEF